MNSTAFIIIAAIYVAACWAFTSKPEPEHEITWEKANIVAITERKLDEGDEKFPNVGGRPASYTMIPAEIGLRDDGVIVFRKSQILSAPTLPGKP